MTDYKDAPVSLAEVRAERSRDGSQWTPRDVLIFTLREIDSGRINPSSLVVSWGGPTDNGKTHAAYASSSPTIIEALGLLSRTMHVLNCGGDGE